MKPLSAPLPSPQDHPHQEKPSIPQNSSPTHPGSQQDPTGNAPDTLHIHVQQSAVFWVIVRKGVRTVDLLGKSEKITTAISYMNRLKQRISEISDIWMNRLMQFTAYFKAIRNRPDRAIIEDKWIIRAVNHPEFEALQEDGRIRRWVRIEEHRGKYLRVVLLPDGTTVHNAFFDRRFKP